jgi:hypothetical protein
MHYEEAHEVSDDRYTLSVNEIPTNVIERRTAGSTTHVAIFRHGTNIAPTFIVPEGGQRGSVSSRTFGKAFCNGLMLVRLSPDPPLKLVFSAAGGPIQLIGGFWRFWALGTVYGKAEVRGYVTLQPPPPKPPGNGG